ncbi:hypothetical protein PL75_02030 [Neisseria arctica]|uniref:Uncharacterized protein n=1 Tax=Neisseria arctica TaxID=1470200 RepID=A0A0J1C5V8_9NEIS|nr:hypothetical protein [Neisseria arctica]KLT73738.1 hypothetical protein PL75_02030 [Neisseria arctica]UOO85877.1 hypothetical protein LVJ86_06455 [Neisseria arctica]
MQGRKQKIWIACLLLVFAVVKIVALLWWKNQQPAIERLTEAQCNVSRGCILPNGVKVKFSDEIQAKGPFDIVLQNVPQEVAEVFVSFSMSGMDMGFNRYKLVHQGSGTWKAEQVRLPVCVQNRYDYLADIHIGKQVFQAAFTAR